MIEINRPRIKYTTGESPDHGILVLEPLERGYGTTLGNSFRRVLLFSLPGSAVSAIKIDGVLHEFCSIPGVVEDVTEIILNLKKMVVNLLQEEPLTVRLDVKGPAQVTAKDIAKHPNLVVVSPDQHLAHVTGDITLGMDITFKRGRGYCLAEQHKENSQQIGQILIDSQFSPVTRVLFNVQDARVGQDINFDKLTLQLWTNGSMRPSDTIELATKFLLAHIGLFSHLEVEDADDGEEAPAVYPEDLVMVSTQKKEPTPKGHTEILIKDLEFSVRSRNCLKKANIHTLGDLVKKRVAELLEIKNFGKKSLKEVREKLLQFNLTLPDDDEADIGGDEEE